MRQIVFDLGSQPIRNIFRNPRIMGLSRVTASNVPLSGPEISMGPYSGGNFRIVDITDLPGFSRAIEVVAIDTSTTRGVIVGSAGYTTGTSGDGAGCPRMAVGDVWTVSAWVKMSAALAPLFGHRWHDTPSMAGTYRAESSPTKAVQQPGVWTRVSHTSTLGVGAAALGAFIGLQARLPANAVVGDTMQVTGIRISRGTDTDYIDGSFPNWTWASATDASESVGYPYTLGNIA